ncbi:MULTISPECIES: hypothetical protein [Streptomyces]|uniref:hypothetical protein n=1 Tax=Streptomyces TaxID=1883 RepID=UPI000D5236A9|nr:hypothetical protein [Streptomyces sp. CS081A]PVC69346.1 hypothetical protein DBP18_20700 [Streptomyces sp. CS081A]
MAIWDTVEDGDRRICAACGTAVRSYQFRLYPPESSMFERCVGLAWCSGCRIYSSAMVHISRTRVLADALGSLPEDESVRLRRSEAKLVDYLDRQDRRKP